MPGTKPISPRKVRYSNSRKRLSKTERVKSTSTSSVEALREIMNLDPEANVIMCSALGQDSLVMEALDTGAKDFIVKPFQPGKVLEVVVRILDETRGS